MDLRIVTLDHSNALKPVARRQTREERQRRKDWRTGGRPSCGAVSLVSVSASSSVSSLAILPPALRLER